MKINIDIRPEKTEPQNRNRVYYSDNYDGQLLLVTTSGEVICIEKNEVWLTVLDPSELKHFKEVTNATIKLELTV